MAEVDQGVVQSVINNNMKTLGEAVSFAAAQMMDNAVAHQNRLNLIAEASVGQIVKNMNEVDPTQAVAQVKQMTGNALAEELGQLGAVIAQLQQIMKGAQTTPPPTA